MPTDARAGEQSGRIVLVTRPEPGASETARRLTEMGFVPLVAPVLEVVPRPLLRPGAPQAVLVTSGNAIAALPAGLHATRLLAVGDATAAKALAAGFTDVQSAGRDAEALAVLAAQVCTPSAGALLLASGAGQGLALAATLRAQGFRVQRRVAYAARPVVEFSVAVRLTLDAGRVDSALFFSPDSARAFMTILQRDFAASLVQGMEALALSKATAAPLHAAAWRRIRIASHPTQNELLALLS